MSFEYRMYKARVRASKVKKEYSLPTDQLVAKSIAAQTARKYKFVLPENNEEFKFFDNKIIGKYHCIKIQNAKKVSRSAVLYLYGGGMLMPPSKKYFKYACDMCRETGRDVFFAYYPLCSTHSILTSVQVVFEMYRMMLEEYEPSKIAIYGFASGASLGMSMLLFNNDIEESLPMPGLYIGISPEGLPADENEYNQMKRLNDKDIVVNTKSMKAVRELLYHNNPDVPGYMLGDYSGNYEGFPESFLFFGQDEVYFAKAERYKYVMEKAGVRTHLRMRDDMCHNYCVSVKFPEAAMDYDEIIDVLKVG
ncbi:MAG: alpha/beta hydrolase [Butyrivibrio sp.]|nr:alpha/beta hydrolase [Butyrivibrio sp.]